VTAANRIFAPHTMLGPTQYRSAMGVVRMLRGAGPGPLGPPRILAAGQRPSAVGHCLAQLEHEDAAEKVGSTDANRPEEVAVSSEWRGPPGCLTAPPLA